MLELTNYIKINEGGHSVEGCEPIKGNLAKGVADEIIGKLKSKFHCECTALGSTGKKSENQTSGDIDIAIEYDWDKYEDVLKFVKDNMTNNIGNINKNLHVFNIGYEYKDGEDIKMVQVDFMFTDNIEFAEFAYHSPDFTKNESKYKGMYQSALMMAAISCVPPEDINKKYTVEYFSDTDYNGKYKTEDKQVKTFWKLNFDQNKGLTIHQKTWEGKTKPLANPQTVKGTEEVITKDINKIIKLCFGDKATKEDFNSFESTIALLVSERYKYCNNNFLHRVRETFLNDWQIKMKTSPELLKELGDLLTEEINNVD